MHRDMRLRNRVAIVFLLPFVIPLWMFGWVLYCKGAKGLTRRWKEAAASDDGLEVAVAVLEDVEVDG